MVRPIDISSSALVAQRIRLNTIASNIANVSTTRNADGDPAPYVRKRVVFETGMPSQDSGQGVHVSAIQDDVPGLPGAEPFRIEYEPGHPDADPLGYVRYPNVDLTKEYVNALETARAYEANVQLIDVARSMASNLSRLLE